MPLLTLLQQHAPLRAFCHAIQVPYSHRVSTSWRIQQDIKHSRCYGMWLCNVLLHRCFACAAASSIAYCQQVPAQSDDEMWRMRTAALWPASFSAAAMLATLSARSWCVSASARGKSGFNRFIYQAGIALPEHREKYPVVISAQQYAITHCRAEPLTRVALQDCLRGRHCGGDVAMSPIAPCNFKRPVLRLMHDRPLPM